ncbi:hybrid sensor histidine kinase/response regulator transcription factor [Christiangramia crocea]|uniref:histidine kinase n=1 Tax=Christiangramia crocea TaxID=2904124 RepID=A0A9X2A929_9FLAO|nr:hybrid sensor histidine kinase/response regulator transcription factor [Gramella crocea]MCG9973097.1 ATP-binding protein [Gramella crocea]
MIFFVCNKSFLINKWVLSCFLIFSSISNYLVAQKQEFRNINSVQGLSHSTVYSITEDSNGFMWFGTREGLNRYDGYKVYTYYSKKNDTSGTGLLDNQINYLLNSSKGILIGTRKGLNRYQPKLDKFTSEFSGSRISESVRVLFETVNNKIFIGTANGLYTLKDNDQIEKLVNNVTVRALCNYKTNVHWMGLNTQVWMINDSGEVIKKYTITPEITDSGTSFNINLLFKDTKGNTWLGTSKGLYLFNENEDSFEFYEIDQNHEIEANVIRTISEGNDGRLWIGTESGIFVHDLKTGTSEHYKQSFDKEPGSLSDKSIYSLYLSDEGITWIGTYFGGVNFTAPQNKGFQKLLPGNNNSSLHGKAVSQIIADNDDKIWIATEDGGISILNRKKNNFSYLNTANGLSSNNIHSLYEDDKGHIWIGTFLGGLDRYDKATGNIKHFKHRNNDPTSISNNYVYSIMEDREDRLWVGTQYGLNIYDPASGNFILFKPETFGNKFIYDMLQDEKGNLWICTRFNGIFRYRPSEDEIQHFSGEDLSSDQIISATETSTGEIWFGTLNGGLLKWEESSGSFKNYTQYDILPNNNVYEIVEGPNKDLWLTTNKGLVRYKTESDTVITYTTNDGLTSNQFNFKSGYKDDDGWLYFGTINGLTYFHPDTLKTKLPPSEMQITGFQLFNEEVPVGQNSILKKNITYTDSISLKHHQNVITFEFAALNYQPGNKYAYFLEGFEDNWNMVGDKRTATYTNLSPGEYTFRVQTLPLNNSQEKKIHLTILPPFWQTNWAYALYFILLLAGIYAYWRFVRFIHNQKLAVKVEKVEKEKIKEVNQHKLNFFTFISHEFKTPLTLIIASIDKYIKGHAVNLNQSEELASIKKSAGKLQHLIQQLMEFRKIETSHVELDLKKGDVILFLKDTFNAFALLMEEKELTYKLKSNISEYVCYFDPDKLEMIATNLLSNAIKNTPEQGEIKLNLAISNKLDEQHRSKLSLEVEDSGVGMNSEEVSKVFNPFFKAGENNSNQWRPGSGIGLALVKNLTDLLDGHIRVDSKKDEGTKIRIDLPLRLKIEEEEKEINFIEGNKTLNIDPHIFMDEQSKLEEVIIEDLPKGMTLLIVEDNRQIIKFLKEHFSTRFKVITAKNGVHALEKLNNYIPDIIISDLIMPEMDGISLCKKVKSNPETNHIPFLLLTGKTDKSYKMEGLRVGANAFINKPFSINELDLLVKNLLETNQNRAKRFSGGDMETIEKIPETNQNREFLKKINDIVIENYNDPKFTIENLASLMGISRSLLHIKMKKATGTSASDYLKKIRLKKAEELIKQGKTISEVAYNVGYSDPNYFSRVFKKEYKVSPSNYK